MAEEGPRLFEYADHWLVKRKDTPNYHIYWCRPGTRRVLRRSTGTPDLEHAKRRLIEFAGSRGRTKPPAPDRVAVLDVVSEYVERHAARRAVHSGERTALGNFATFFGRENVVFVSEVSIDLIEAFCEWRREGLLRRGYRASNGTINRELEVLRAALREAWKRGRLASAPHIPLLPRPPARERFLTAAEARRLLDTCHEPHLRTYVMLALHTLQRPGAILDLRTEQVDLDLGRINFLASGRTQTTKRRPVVRITPSLRPELEEAIAGSVTGHVVEFEGKPIRSVKTAFANACRRAELEGVSPYTLRHTGATLMAAAGVPLREIAGMLGHTNERTTEIYAKHHPDFQLRATSAIEALFGNGAQTARLPDLRAKRAPDSGDEGGERAEGSAAKPRGCLVGPEGLEPPTKPL